MKLYTMINVNGWFGIMIERNGPIGLFQNPITGDKICHSLIKIQEKEIVFYPN